MLERYVLLPFFFFNDTATTEIYTLSLHDALPIFLPVPADPKSFPPLASPVTLLSTAQGIAAMYCIGRAAESSRSEEHTSELQSLRHLVCRLLLDKKKAIDPQAAGLKPPFEARSST